MLSFSKKIIILTIIFNLLLTGVVFAQSEEVETKRQETEKSINELINAKDEDSSFDISLRIKTLKYAVDLAIAEAKDLKINLIALELENEQIKKWREETIEELNKIIKSYEEKLNSISENENSLTLEEVRQLASDFQSWREENYLPLQEQIHDLFLIKTGSKALQISNRRVEKIGHDLETLEKANFKELKKLSTMFEDAKEIIKNSEEENKTVLNLFIEKYTTPAETATSTTTSTIINDTSASATGTTSTENTFLNSSTTTSTPEILIQSTTTEGLITSDAKQNESIRDLVKSSWNKIKDAYQIFIEMSGFVRKSLQ
jgi:hypothetical protein